MNSKIFGLGLGTFALATSGLAQLGSVGPFVGVHSDGFENSPNYSNGGIYSSLQSSDGFMNFTSVPGTANDLYIYEPGAANWGLDSNGLATVNSGSKGLGLFTGSGNANASLTFAAPVTEFGGYFASDSTNTHFYLTFFDQNGAFIQQTDIYGTGNTMQWHGFQASGGTEIGMVLFSGNVAPVMDDLQASPTPEPLTCGLLGLGALALVRRRKTASPGR